MEDWGKEAFFLSRILAKDPFVLATFVIDLYI